MVQCLKYLKQMSRFTGIIQRTKKLVNNFSSIKVWAFIFFKFFIIRKSLGIPRTVFQRYQPGTFMSLAMQNPRRLFIFSCVLKSDTLDVEFQKNLFFIELN